jgi:hypothetical protein
MLIPLCLYCSIRASTVVACSSENISCKAIPAGLPGQYAVGRLDTVNPKKWLTYLFEKIKVAKGDQLHLPLPQNYAAVISLQ